jgi:hypothetical protein
LAHAALGRWAPSNRLIAAARANPGAGRAALLAAAAAACLAGAVLASSGAASGGPGWLHAVFLWLFWDAAKLAAAAPAALVWAARTRRATRQGAMWAATHMGPGRVTELSRPPSPRRAARTGSHPA